MASLHLTNNSISLHNQFQFTKMKVFKFFQYAYLLFAVVFLYDVISTYMASSTISWGSLLLAGAAIFMFFFRKRFNKKFDNN